MPASVPRFAHVCLIGAISFLPGCGPGAQPKPTTPQAPEKSAQVTVWGDRFEIFLEHRFVVAGTPTNFATHVTDLVTLEPRSAGPIRYVMRGGGDKAVEHEEKAPSRPGIYNAKLSFPTPGVWSIALHIPIEGGESMVRLPPISVYASRDDAEKAPEPEVPEGISFLKEQQWKVLTKVEPVATRRLTENLRLVGTVSPLPSTRAVVTAPLAGRILAPDRGTLPALGVAVKAGDTLALVQPPFSDFAVKLVEARAEVARSKLSQDRSELSLQRIQLLVAENARSERELQEADFALREAKAAHEAAISIQSAFERAGAGFVMQDADGTGESGLPVIELKAPISGFLVEIGAAAGEYVTPERSLFEILDPDRVLVEARVPEAEVDRIGASAAASYELPGRSGEFVPILANGAGRLLFFGLKVDPRTRTVPIAYEVPNPGRRLRVGAALTLYVETARAEETLAVPESALVEEEGRPIVFVQVAGETFEKRSPKLGIRDSGWVQVLSGLSEGERVATKEAYAIRLASVSTAIPAHGHQH